MRGWAHIKLVPEDRFPHSPWPIFCNLDFYLLSGHKISFLRAHRPAALLFFPASQSASQFRLPEGSARNLCEMSQRNMGEDGKEQEISRNRKHLLVKMNFKIELEFGLKKKKISNCLLEFLRNYIFLVLHTYIYYGMRLKSFRIRYLNI